MADKSKIEWTDATWNPICARNRASGGVGHYCAHVSDGCKNCYAERLQSRFQNDIRFAAQDRDKVDIFLDEKTLTQPLRWKKPRMIFVCSMTDLFGDWVGDEWIDQIFAVMALCPQHTFQMLTKRPERMREYCSTIQKNGRWLNMEQVALDLGYNPRGADDHGFDWLSNKEFIPNVWLGTSVEDQKTADERIPHLLETPAAVRFLSVEPLLGPVDLTKTHKGGDPAVWNIEPLTGWGDPGCLAGVGVEPVIGPKLNWVIVGGESGPRARPMHPDWVRTLRDQCGEASVPFFFKQCGEWSVVYDRDVDDLYWRDWPESNGPHERYINIKGGHGFHNDRVVLMRRVGKARAGRTLDGQTWDQMPGGLRA